MKIVYVTGCLGLIGSHITRLCLERNWYVIGVDSCTYVSNACHLEDFKKYKNFKFIKSDINDLETLYDCDYIINTAAETHVANSLVDSTKFFKTNISGVEKLLNLIRKLNNNTSFPTLIHFSSYEVYGNNCDSDVTEKSILNPVNPYSATKASADMVIQAFNATYNVPYIIVRPNCNYGVGQYVEKLIPKFCKYSLLKKKFPLHNGGTTTRTWLNALDTANAVMRMIDSGSKNEIFNVSSNSEYSNFDVCNMILDTYYPEIEDKSEFYDLSYIRNGQNFKFYLDDSKIRQLGWKEKTVFTEEIVKIANYYKENFIW